MYSRRKNHFRASLRYQDFAISGLLGAPTGTHCVCGTDCLPSGSSDYDWHVLAASITEENVACKTSPRPHSLKVSQGRYSDIVHSGIDMKLRSPQVMPRLCQEMNCPHTAHRTPHTAIVIAIDVSAVQLYPYPHPAAESPSISQFCER